jgi:20S proteasome alpha/beta subunit
MDKEDITRVLLNAMRNAHSSDPESWVEIGNEVEVSIACLIDIAKREAIEEMRDEMRRFANLNDLKRGDRDDR